MVQEDVEESIALVCENDITAENIKGVFKFVPKIVGWPFRSCLDE